MEREDPKHSRVKTTLIPEPHSASVLGEKPRQNQLLVTPPKTSPQNIIDKRALNLLIPPPSHLHCSPLPKEPLQKQCAMQPTGVNCRMLRQTALYADMRVTPGHFTDSFSEPKPVKSNLNSFPWGDPNLQEATTASQHPTFSSHCQAEPGHLG